MYTIEPVAPGIAPRTNIRFSSPLSSTTFKFSCNTLTEPMFRLTGGTLPEHIVDRLIVAERLLASSGFEADAAALQSLIDQSLSCVGIDLDQKRAMLAERVVSPNAAEPVVPDDRRISGG